MPVSVSHALSATTPDDPAWEIRPSHWNSNHIATISAVGSEIFGAFSNDPSVNVSFSTNPSGFVIASANVTAAPSPVNVTGANGSSVNAQTIAFSNSNGMTLGVSTAANGATITGSYTVPTVPTAYVSSVNGSSGAISLNVGSSLSASTNGSSITFGLRTDITTALQSANANYLTSQSNQAFSAAGGSSAFQTLSFSNGGGVSFTNTNGQVGASVVTSYRASNDAVGLNTAQSNVTWTVNSSGLSLDARGYAGTTTAITGAASLTLNSGGLQFNGAGLAGTSSGFTGANISASITHNTAGLALSMSVAAPGGGAGFSAGVSGGNTSGDTGATGTRVVFAGGNNITLSQATDANGATITVSGANAGGAQTGISGIVVSNTTYTSGTVSFSNANGISFGSSAGQAITASYTVPTVTNSSWTVSDNATSATVGRLAFTQSNGITMSLSTSNNGNHTVIASHNGLTSQSNQNVTAGNGGFAFQTLSFSNANAFSFGTSAGSAITGSYTVPTVTDYFSKTNTTFNGANISGSMTMNTNGLQLSLSVAAPGAAAENNNHNLLGANTAGNTTASGSTIGLSGINLTLSGTNNSVINISAPATSSLVGTSGMSISTNGSTISVQPIARSEWNNISGISVAGVAQANSLVSIQPFMVEWPVVISNVMFGMSIAPVSTTNNSSAYIDVSASGVVYSRNASTLSSMFSFSVTNTATWTSNATATAGGPKLLSATFGGTTLTPGNYWLAIHLSTTNSTTGGAATTILGNAISMMLGQNNASNAIGAVFWGSTGNNTFGINSGMGVISTGATVASIPFSSITVSGTRGAAAPVAFGLRNDTYQ